MNQMRDDDRDQTRQIERVINDFDQTQEDPAGNLLEPDISPDRTKEMSHLGFQRMRIDWGADKKIIDRVHLDAEEIILELFPKAFEIRLELFEVVRTPEVDPATGEVRKNLRGETVWKRNEFGSFIEDWGLLGNRMRSDFLYQITAHLFEWEQTSAKLWANAMFSKGIWEERFAHGYLSPEGKLTIHDKTQLGRRASIEERYFAIFQTYVSRLADALVRSMQLINQRLKDGMSF